MNTRTDPIELELFRHLLVSIAEEMGAVLRKTAYSANIKERRDYSCAVYDDEGATVAMGDHMPVHLGAMPLSVREAMKAVRLGPGDVVILNDPFRGGTHLPDITAVSAIYCGGQSRPAFHVANRAHHADVGGMSPGSMPLAREIYQEGLRIPPVLLVRGGEIQRDVMNLVLTNVRTPTEREGDLLAQCMAIRRGEQRLRELVARYSLPTLARNMSALQDYSERMVRAAVASLPAGEFSFEDWLDGDGVRDRPIRIAVRIRIKGSSAIVDFTGSDPQAAGPVNANYAVALSASMYVFRCLVRDDIPYTEGVLRPITVIAPSGTVVNARLPSAMGAGNVETSQRITDVLLGALAKAAPDRIPAASSGTMNNLTFGGWDPIRNRAWAWYETVAGGMGASAAAAGRSATHTHMTNSWNTPIEAFEHEYPVRIRGYHIRHDSGGEGRHRGGDGIVRAYEMLAPAEATILSDRRARGPYGLAGGSPGRSGRNTVRNGRSVREKPSKARFELNAGETLIIETPGGGGWGRP